METVKLNNSPALQARVIVAAAIWLLGVVYVGFVPAQSDFAQIILPYSAAFAAYLVCIRYGHEDTFKTLLITGILARLALVVAFPQLSDDVYRFVWDGRVLHEGLNPYSYLPDELLDRTAGLNAELYSRLNSPGYYSVYPPLAQFIFYLGGFFAERGIEAEVIAQKLILLGFELGALRMIYVLLRDYGMTRKKILLYALNPLVVVEIMGNMHHEGMMLFFILLAVWYLQKNRSALTGVSLALATASKMLPLMFAPALFLWQHKNRRGLFVMATGIALVVFFTPLLFAAGTSLNYGASLDLYLRKFEFNAGLYYVLRWIGFQIKGYNLIHIFGPVLAISATGGIIYLAWQARHIKAPRGLWTVFLASFTWYLLLSMTVHPWYVILPVGLCIFTRFRYPIIWSYLIFWTYLNYSYPQYHEFLVVVFVEYVIVYWLIYREIRKE